MANPQINFEILLLLLKASSKQQVVDICQEAFKNRDKEISDQVLKLVADGLSVELGDTSKLFKSLSAVIKNVLFNGHSSYESIYSVFPDDFHKNLRDLLSKIISEKYTNWKSSAVTDFASMPQLAEFDWRVDLKMASGKIPRMSEPTCILHLKIQDPGVPESHEERFQSLNVELSKEKLDTMLHGLGRIRDQLSAVAKK